MGKPWWGSQRRKMALTVTSAIMVRPHASVVRSGWSPGSPCGPGSGRLVRTTGLTPEDKDEDDGGSQSPGAGQQRHNERQRERSFVAHAPFDADPAHCGAAAQQHAEEQEQHRQTLADG